MTKNPRRSTQRPLLDRKAAAEYLGVTDRMFKTLHESRRIPHIKLTERAVRFDPDDLDAYVESQRVPALRSA